LGVPLQIFLSNLQYFNLKYAFISSFVSIDNADSVINQGGIIIYGHKYRIDEVLNSLLYGILAGTITAAILAFTSKRRRIGWRRLTIALFIGLEFGDAAPAAVASLAYNNQNVWTYFWATTPQNLIYNALGGASLTALVVVLRRYWAHSDDKRVGLLNLRLSFSRSITIGLAFPVIFISLFGALCYPIPGKIMISMDAPASLTLNGVQDAWQAPFFKGEKVLRADGRFVQANSLKFSFKKNNIFINPHGHYLSIKHIPSFPVISSSDSYPTIPGYYDLDVPSYAAGYDYELGFIPTLPGVNQKSPPDNTLVMKTFDPSQGGSEITKIAQILAYGDANSDIVSESNINRHYTQSLETDKSVIFLHRLQGFIEIRRQSDKDTIGAEAVRIKGILPNQHPLGSVTITKDGCGAGCTSAQMSDGFLFGLQGAASMSFISNRCRSATFDFLPPGKNLLDSININTDLNDNDPYQIIPDVHLPAPYFNDSKIDVLSENLQTLKTCNAEPERPVFLLNAFDLFYKNQAMYIATDEIHCPDCGETNLNYQNVAVVRLQGGAVTAQVGAQAGLTIPIEVPLAVYDSSSVLGNFGKKIEIKGDTSWVVENTIVLNSTLYEMLPIEIKVAFLLGFLEFVGFWNPIKKRIRLKRQI
jgi:hypothetical protein